MPFLYGICIRCLLRQELLEVGEVLERNKKSGGRWNWGVCAIGYTISKSFDVGSSNHEKT